MSWMMTNTGKKFYFNRISAKSICLEDIAHALSYTCRYNGHCHTYYSVAEHSCHMAEYFANKYAGSTGNNRKRAVKLTDMALMHDATEAYIGDMTRPLKSLMPAFQEYENKLWAVIAKKYHLPPKLDAEVKEADSRILINEKRFLFPADSPLWGVEGELSPLDSVVIRGFTPDAIYPIFLHILRDRFGKYD